MSARHLEITLNVNGEPVAARVEARKTLVDFLREDLALTGSHVGCEHGVCGACTVLLNGEVVRGCLTFAVQCDGAEVETIEGLSDSDAIADLQRAFQERNALQCGYCTPGILISARELLPRASCRAARPSASISQAIIAAAPAIRRSSMRSRRWRYARFAPPPGVRGRWRAKRAGRGKYWLLGASSAPSTMLRMVPLPRFAGGG